VIMTSHQDKDFYSDVSLSADIIESKLQNNLVEGVCVFVCVCVCCVYVCVCVCVYVLVC
jgi:hypothetical protein